MAALSENGRKVLDYVMAQDGADITANDIAEATGLTIHQVNGVVTSAFKKKGFMTRVPGEITLEDGTHKPVKFIYMTEEGLKHDFDAEEDAE